MTTDDGDAEDDRLLAGGEYGPLFGRHYDDLLALARMRVGADRAVDLVQTGLLRTWRELRAGTTWPVPFRVVVRQHLYWAIGDLKGEVRPAGLPDGWDVADPFSEEAYRQIDDRLGVERLLEGLPGGDRRVMVLRFIDGRSPAQIAEHLGMTRNAVDQALWRGRRAIREAWPDG